MNRIIINRLCRTTSLLLLVLVTQLCFALPDDRDKPMTLAAGSANLNHQTHMGVFLENVELDQGTTHLRAAKATTEGNAKNQLILAVATGNKEAQAHLWTQTALDKPLLHAYADIIRYYPERHLVELIGNARVEQGNNSFSAPHINYDTVQQHVISKSDGTSRTLIIIHPEKHK